MALGATHIRFAVDLVEKFKPSDLDAYVSGTLYPDSRYVSGIDRELTHPKEFDYDFFLTDDFRKGWLVHLLCDLVQYEVHKDLLPESFEGTTGQGSETWIKRTSLKALQDIDDARKFDLVKYLSGLSYTENPNGEPIEKVKEYNDGYLKLYRDPNAYVIEDVVALCRRWNIGDELSTQILAKSKEYQQSEHIMDTISRVYDEMIIRVAKPVDLVLDTR